MSISSSSTSSSSSSSSSSTYPLLVRRRVSATLACSMKLHYYPLDVQSCPMMFESCEYPYAQLFSGVYIELWPTNILHRRVLPRASSNWKTNMQLQLGLLLFYFLNPLEFRGNYSATSNNMMLVHWPLMGGLLHLVQRGCDWAEPQPGHDPPRCTKCNSPPINGQCTNLRF